MLNNFCFHLYAQKSLFIAENCNAFFDILITLPCEFGVHWAGSQLKMTIRLSNGYFKATNKKWIYDIWMQKYYFLYSLFAISYCKK